MTDLASLVIEVDSRQPAQAATELDKLSAAGQRTGVTIDQAERYMRKASIQLEQMGRASQTASNGTLQHSKAIVQATVSAGAQRAGMQQLGFQLQDFAVQVAGGTSATRAFAQQFPQALGAVQLMTSSTSKLGAFLGGPWGIALGVAAAALVPLVSKLFEGKEKADDLTDASETLAQKLDLQRHAFEEVIKAAREYNNEMERSRQVTLDAAAAAARAAAQDIQSAIAKRQKLQAQLEENRAMMAGGIDSGDTIGANIAAQRAKQTQAAIDQNTKALETLRTTATETVVGVGRELGKLNSDPKYAITESFKRARFELEKLGLSATELARRQAELYRQEQAALKAYDESQRTDHSGERRAERLARESAALDVLINGLYKAATAYGVSTAAGMRARIEAEAMEKGMKRQADVAAYAAQQQLKWVAQEVEGSAASTAEMLDRIKAQEFVNKAVREGTMLTDDASEALSNMAEQQKLMTVMAVARANSDVRGYAAAEKALAALTEAQLRDIAARKEAEDLSRADQINRQIEDIQLQTKLMKDLGAARINAMRGLSGNALDDELAKIAAQHEKIAIQAQAEAEKTRLLKLGYDDAAAAVMRKAEADKTQVDARLEIEQQIRQIEILTDRVNALSGAFSNIKGMGPLGDLFGVLTSRDPTAALLGMGGVGSLLGMFTKGGNEAYLKFGDQMTRALEGVFGPKAENLAETMAGLLQGAGTGSIVGNVLGGGKTAQFGSMIGGALGQEFGKQAIGAISGSLLKSLGGAAGPIGAIAGSILGGLLGGALSSTKKGRATFAGDSYTTSGNSQQRIGAASDLAGSVLDALKQIGDAFDATVGTFDGTIGVRKNSIRYNASGTSLKQGANFGQDSAAAIAAAISDAISDGVFTGLSDGVERLLKNGGDLETQLQKALSFQGVFDELKKMKDPQGAALDDLTKWHDNMLAIFNEAGATSDQLAQLEELTGLKRQEIVEKYGDAIANAEDIANQKRQLEIQIMQLEGKTVEALAAARQMEKDAADASLGPLYDRIYALQDEAAAAQKAARIMALQARLFDAQGNSAAAEALRQKQELADAQSDQERELLERIYAAERAAQRAAAAEQRRQAAAQAAEEAARRAEEVERTRTGLYIDMLRSVGLEEQATALSRAQALKALDASQRPLQQFAWQIEDATAGLSDTIKQFQDFGDSLREFRDSLTASAVSQADAYRAAQVKFLTTSALAAAGDATGLGDLQKVSTAFLDASKSRATSALQFQRDQAAVLRAVNAGIGAAGQTVSGAESQLQAARDAVAELIDVNGSLDNIETALTGGANLPGVFSGFEAYLAELRQDREDAKKDREEAKAERVASVLALNKIKRILEDSQQPDRSLGVTVKADETA